MIAPSRTTKGGIVAPWPKLSAGSVDRVCVSLPSFASASATKELL